MSSYYQDRLDARRARSCESKKRYDKKGAQTAINQARHRRGRHGNSETLRAYPCSFCGGWHLTHRPE